VVAAAVQEQHQSDARCAAGAAPRAVAARGASAPTPARVIVPLRPRPGPAPVQSAAADAHTLCALPLQGGHRHASGGHSPGGGGQRQRAGAAGAAEAEGRGKGSAQPTQGQAPGRRCGPPCLQIVLPRCLPPPCISSPSTQRASRAAPPARQQAWHAKAGPSPSVAQVAPTHPHPLPPPQLSALRASSERAAQESADKLAAMEYELTGRLAEATGGIRGLTRAKEAAAQQIATMRVGGLERFPGPVQQQQPLSATCCCRLLPLQLLPAGALCTFGELAAFGWCARWAGSDTLPPPPPPLPLPPPRRSWSRSAAHAPKPRPPCPR
jgi:hypothetical protein